MSYTGKWIHIDLSTGEYKTGEPDQELLEKYIGGKGLGFALLNKMAPKPDPLGSENPLIFINGPFTGSKVQTSARTALVSKSPLTNSIHDCHCGGYFGPALKRAGYDYLIVTGKSEKPVYIYIYEDKIEIKDASDFWGKGIFETNDKLIERHKGNDPRIAAIGQAGENLSRMACIGVDKHRQFGRGGLGAVMGSKKLKAVVVDGKKAIEYYDEEKFKKLNKKFAKDLLTSDDIKDRRKKGTLRTLRQAQTFRFLPTKNYQEVEYDEFENLTSETARKVLDWEDTSCYGCAIQCSKWANWDGHKIEGPEYETTAFLGSGCEINDIKDVSFANEICNDVGLDTISTGVTCSFAMECYEKGILDNWDGLKLEWGNAEAQREFLEMITYRKGIGKIFADGTKVASEKIGKGSEKFAMNVFGMEISGVNPLGSLTMGIADVVSDFASHTRLWCTEAEMGEDFKIEDIPETVAKGLDEVNTRNSLIACDFVSLGLGRMVPLLNAAIGSDYTEEALMEVGRRITHLSRVYNLRNGRTYKDDILPERFFNVKSLAGFMEGKVLDKEFFKDLVHQVYEIRGWNDKGEPTEEILKEYSIK
ncbi:MAG: aldehyde ferredoxin oxidoreductase family protein [Candidatus Cloacimonetes bacterium]|nr:aldehyde ferredoxin oxidoreductase family protein [Candidatus Cloacimonadota bacterium]